MSGLLLDANIISEIGRPRPDLRVLAFLRANAELWLSAIAVHEVEYGIQRLDAGRRQERYRQALSEVVAEHVQRILGVGRLEAVHAASLRVEAARSGRTLHIADALIAGTARANDLAIATRNVRDFEGLDVEVVNPWEPLPPTTSR